MSLKEGHYLNIKENLALYTTKDHRIFMAESELPNELNGDHVLVQMKANGICGSDIHFWKSGDVGEVHVDGDYVLGHEGAGVVIQVGPDVHDLQPGDRVAVEPGVPCAHCVNFSEGEYNLCPHVQFSGAYPYYGSIRQYHIHPAPFLHKLPKELSFSEGALLEPLSVVMHAIERAPLKIGQPCVVFGAGPIGMIALICAKASGAFPLLIVDIVEERLQKAKELVPESDMLCISVRDSPEHVGQQVGRKMKSLGCVLPTTILECTGVESSVASAAFSCRRGGVVMVIGVGKQRMNLPFMHLSMSEIDLKFINRYHHTWASAIRLLRSGYINLKPLVTHTFPLSKAVEAMEFVANPSNGGIKIHILEDG